MLYALRYRIDSAFHISVYDILNLHLSLLETGAFVYRLETSDIFLCLMLVLKVIVLFALESYQLFIPPVEIFVLS